MMVEIIPLSGISTKTLFLSSKTSNSHNLDSGRRGRGHVCLGIRPRPRKRQFHVILTRWYLFVKWLRSVCFRARTIWHNNTFWKASQTLAPLNFNTWQGILALTKCLIKCSTEFSGLWNHLLANWTHFYRYSGLKNSDFFREFICWQILTQFYQSLRVKNPIIFVNSSVGQFWSTFINLLVSKIQSFS